MRALEAKSHLTVKANNVLGPLLDLPPAVVTPKVGLGELILPVVVLDHLGEAHSVPFEAVEGPGGVELPISLFVIFLGLSLFLIGDALEKYFVKGEE